MDALIPQAPSPELSPRAQIAQAIADYITQAGLNNPFGGTVTRSRDRRAYVVDFSAPAWLDGAVRVYSPTFIQVSSAGRLAPNGDDTRVFTSTQDAIDFLRLAYVNHDRDAAEAIPTKEQKPRNSTNPRRV